MLVMRRKAGEAFRIGDSVEIRILEISPNRVRIGVSAPPELTIVREEIVLTREENLRAVCDAPAQAIELLASQLKLAPRTLTGSQDFDGGKCAKNAGKPLSRSDMDS